MTLKRGLNSTKGDNPDCKKNTGQLLFDEESIYEISKPYLKFETFLIYQVFYDKICKRQ